MLDVTQLQTLVVAAVELLTITVQVDVLVLVVADQES